MNIHGLCLVRNEADIIEQTLRAATAWCDHVYVFDNGSIDGTWETVRELALELPAVIPYKQDARPFDDSIRNEILLHYKACAARGDWWCVLDADEFYMDEPREFLARVPARYRAVWMQLYTYLFTEQELASFLSDPTSHDDNVPIQDRLHHYVLGEYHEPRFFRHSPSLRRVPGADLQPIYPRLIRMKHYPYRTPDQIRLRLDTRREPIVRGQFPHEKRSAWVPDAVVLPGPAAPDDIPRSWDERVVSSSECDVDRGDGIYAEADPWTPPTGPSVAARMRSGTRSVLRRARRAVAGLFQV